MRGTGACTWLAVLSVVAFVRRVDSIEQLRFNVEKLHAAQADHPAQVDDGHGHGHDDEGHGHGPNELVDDADFGEESPGHHAHEPEPASILVATMLLGMVAWIMSLFYFVNWPDPDVRQATWDTLSAMVTIFCGVLLFSALKGVFIDFAGEAEGDHHSPPDPFSLALSATRFFIMFLMLQMLLYAVRTHHMRLLYIGSVGSHVVGFAAIDVFGSALQMPFIATSMVNSVLAVLGAFLILFLMYHSLALARQQYASDHKEFQVECDEFDGESIGLCVGLLVSLVLRKAITGDMPPVHGSPRHKTQDETLILFAVSVGGGLYLVLLTYIVDLLPHTSYTVHRAVHLVQECASMTMGWCLLYTGYWQFYIHSGDKDTVGGPMTMRILMALIFSAITFAAIIVIDMLADRASPKLQKGLRHLLVTFSLLMGLSWEASFSHAVEDVGYYMEVKNNEHGYLGYGYVTTTMVSVFLTLCLCIIVLPAWAWYVLPMTSSCKEHAENMHQEKVADEHVENRA